MHKKMKSRALSIRKQSLQSIPLPLENKAIKTQRLQPELLDTNGAPLTMTKTTQIQLPQYDVPPPWAIYARKWTTPSSWSHIDCVATRVTDLFTQQQLCTTVYTVLVEERYDPPGEHSPRKRMKDNFQILSLRTRTLFNGE
jgi:glycerophosphoryl diester phosphodiesterase